MATSVGDELEVAFEARKQNIDYRDNLLNGSDVATRGSICSVLILKTEKKICWSKQSIEGEWCGNTGRLCVLSWFWRQETKYVCYGNLLKESDVAT